ncbi:ferredoxin--NADP reductase [Bordetella sp. FB-8]|uniref:ferredoxin--NADP reductase n=1 Tax=Bordetella sp. FB-8 TaxID=1159870 RepID=UPI000369CB3A|nr:ferredoxin--NADP reductase [Bordetella sp. FB-8]
MAEEKYTRQTVTHVRAWVPGKLFSLRVSRDPAYAFQPGQFARLGLAAEDAHDCAAPPGLWRAYSMVSAPHEAELEFYSIVVPEGQFSPRLARLRPGDALYVDKTPFGFLTLERFPDGEDLWLLATGTGLSAYMSILRDPTVRRRFRRVALVHGVRTAEELAYRDEIQALAGQDPGLTYLPIATRETLPGMPQDRLTTLVADGGLERLAGLALDPARSRVMLCGNPAMLADARKLLGERGFAPGRRGIPGNLAVENYW